jgi:HEAT repeat protein
MRLLQVALCGIVLLASCQSEAMRARKGLDSPDPESRVASARRLGELRDKVAVPRLCELLEDSVPSVRAEVAHALGRIANRRAIEPLVVAAAAEEQEVVAVVMTGALASHGGPAIDALIRLLGSRWAGVRVAACRSLGRLRAGNAVRGLIDRLGDADASVRAAAGRALRRIGDPAGLEALARRVERSGAADDGAAGQELGGEGYDAQLEQARRLARRGLQ